MGTCECKESQQKVLAIGGLHSSKYFAKMMEKISGQPTEVNRVTYEFRQGLLAPLVLRIGFKRLNNHLEKFLLTEQTVVDAPVVLRTKEPPEDKR